MNLYCLIHTHREGMTIYHFHSNEHFDGHYEYEYYDEIDALLSFLNIDFEYEEFIDIEKVEENIPHF